MLKKVLKWSGISLLTVVIALALLPFLFKDKIKSKIIESINKNVNATVALEDVSLNLFKSFPKATVTLDKMSVINKAPFQGDTLVYSEKIDLKMSMMELFNGEKEPMTIQSIGTENTKINILFNKDGIGNYDIAIKKAASETNEKEKPFALSIQNYEVENLKFTYKDAASKMKLVLDSINHEGTGNFEQEVLDLDTKTTAKVTFDMDKSNFMRNVPISLEAILGVDLKNSKYTFKENKALINQLPLNFNGFIQMVEKGQVYDLTFNTPSSDFKNFLGLIPVEYAGNLADVETTGKFEVKGKVKGNLSDTTVPSFDIEMLSNNASFKYKDLPKSVKNISIDTHIVNETGLMNDTFVDLDKLSFAIDQDVFNASAHIKNLTENPNITATLKGVINLANVSKAYPVKLEKPLNGILRADVKMAFDMKSVETSQYQNIRNSGNINVTGFNYSGPEMAKPVSVSVADLSFNPSKINLNKLQAKTGKSDINVSGSLDNFYGFLFKNQILKGNFNLNSSLFEVADFMSPTTTTNDEGKKTSEQVKIPSFLDCTLTAKATTVIYDNLNLKNVAGTLIIRDQAVNLKGLNMAVFGGKIGVNGMVSTKNKVPTFVLDMGLSAVDISQTFSMLNTLKTIAPVADVINGKMNSTISLNGFLTQDMIPDVKSISGDLMGNILQGSLNKNKSALLTELDNKAAFLDLKDINLKDVKAVLSFKNGKVAVKPFTLKHKDISVQIAGSHGFDQNMDYNLKFDVPVKYLGNDVNKLLAKVTPSDAKKIESVNVNAMMSGNFKSPKVTTDVQQASKNVASQLIQLQKEKLVQKGTGVLTTILNGNKPKDSTKTTTKEQVGNAVKDGLKGLFGKKKN
ncbi:AsmA-like C-terminal region-containing protein [Flavobacterium sp.]|uniref:AsmA-like C-terminal region-containing protein n=1 Tax=Flavobacterium sp. TaxID=239 RepID=UPI0033424A20